MSGAGLSGPGRLGCDGNQHEPRRELVGPEYLAASSRATSPLREAQRIVWHEVTPAPIFSQETSVGPNLGGFKGISEVTWPVHGLAARWLTTTILSRISPRTPRRWRAAIRRRSGYARILIARAITSAPMPRDTIASMIISSLAHGFIAEMSVGLKAVAVQKPSDR